MSEMLKSPSRSENKFSAFFAYIFCCLILSGSSFHKYDSINWSDILVNNILTEHRPYIRKK